MSTKDTILSVIHFLEKHGIPTYDWMVHNIVFLLEYHYNIDTGYGACEWVYQPYGVWCEDLYADTRRLIEKGKLYRLEIGQLKLVTKPRNNLRIPYQLSTMRPREMVDLVFEVYNELFSR